jgi:hypothetical protein
MEDLAILNGHLVYFMAIWFIIWLFGIVFPGLVSCTKRNLATLAEKLEESFWPRLCFHSGEKFRISLSEIKGVDALFIFSQFRPHFEAAQDGSYGQGCQIFLDAKYQNGGKYNK